MSDFDGTKFIKRCKEHLIEDYAQTNGVKLEEDQVYVVWSCKILNHAKVLLATSISGDGAYYEFTYNGIRDEIYMDAYDKQRNQAFKANI